MPTTDPPGPNPFEKLTAFLPLFWLSLAFLAGILFAQAVHASTLLWVVLAAGALAFALVARLRALQMQVQSTILLAPARLFLVTLSLAAFCLGAARYQATIPTVNSQYIASYNDQDYELLVTGSLADPPDVRDSYSNLRVRVTSVNTGDQTLSVTGLILARVSSGGDWHYGDVVRLRGHLQTPPANEGFSYQDYLAHQNILAYMPYAEATLLPFTAGSPLLKLIYTFKAYALTRVTPSPKRRCWPASCWVTPMACRPRSSRPTSTPAPPISSPSRASTSPSSPGCSCCCSAACWASARARLPPSSASSSIPCWWGPPLRWCAPPSWAGWAFSPFRPAGARTA
jgi:hypothetical protein